MTHLTCVNEDDLRAFALGELPAAAAAAVAAHLDTCPDCEAVVGRLDALTDPIIRSLRQALGIPDSKAVQEPGPGGGVEPTLSPPCGTPAEGQPRRVAGYEILGELGRGGMCVVYRARQPSPSRVVALKMILAGTHAGPEERARFLREADAIARLRHPHVVQVYEVGEHGGLPFFSLELVGGGSLAQKLAGVPQPPRAAAALVEVLARAVHYAHGQGVVHRDLKPANILLTEQGEPKITDFGLAKQDGPGLTATGAVLGTASYMAPEQAEGDNRAVGPAADIYALGAILYEMLTGRPPFQGPSTVETLLQVRRQEPVPPSRLQPGCPRDLETISLKCLQKEPGHRYATAQDLADDLRRFLDRRPIRARPVSAVGQALSWARRNPGWAAMLLATAGLLLVIAVGSTMMSLHLDDALGQARAAQGHAENAEARAKAELWAGYLAQAQVYRLRHGRGQRFESLDYLRKALRLPVPPGRSLLELRNEALACLVLPDVQIAKEWDGNPTGTEGIAFDPSFARYARIDKDGNVSLRRLADDRQLVRLRGWGRPTWTPLVFSPDGKFLAHRCGPNGRLKLWRLEGSGATQVGPARDTVAHDSTPAFSEDGRQLAVPGQGGTVHILSTADGVEVSRHRLGQAAMTLAFRPGREQLAVQSGADVLLVGLRGGRVLRTFAHPTFVESIAWRPDGRILATACYPDRNIRLWDADSGREILPPLDGHRRDGICVAFDRTGEWLLSNDWGGKLRVWDARTGEPLFATACHARQTGAGGRWLGWEAEGERVRVFRCEFGRGRRSLALPPELKGRWIERVVFSPDGQFLLVATNAEVLIYDWRAGEARATLPLGLVYRLFFEPSGALLTHSREGLLRWPVHRDEAAATLRLGPPRVLSRFPAKGWQTGVSADGAVVAMPNYQRGARVWIRSEGEVDLGPAENATCCAVSPDGRWVATGNHSYALGVTTTVWDLRARRAVKELRLAGSGGVAFTPDGRWLLTTINTVRLWKVGTWEEGPRAGASRRVGARTACSPDGQLLALPIGEGQVQLIELDRATEVGRLTAPQSGEVWPDAFSPDGTLLATIADASQTVQVWDLRALRGQLKGLGLDWDLPAYPPARPGHAALDRVSIDLGDLAAPRHP